MAMSVASQQSNAEGTCIPELMHPGVMGLASVFCLHRMGVRVSGWVALWVLCAWGPGWHLPVYLWAVCIYC